LAANLNYNGLAGWRLASNTPVNGSSFNTSYSFNGSTDIGYNITSPNSELAYMYNVNLGLADASNATGAFQSNFGIFGNASIGGQNNVGLVNNLQSDSYWSGTEYLTGFRTGFAWYFYTGSGFQSTFTEGSLLYAWAVRPGDVSAVPAPPAFWLFGSGLMSLLGLRRRGKIG
jgi:hypothetical protein